ncbi:MAG: hypothetical protein MK193_06660 [Lentisphaeria bacterium]|nr:hypothetical protein [Lentisphaeria bacterium]
MRNEFEELHEIEQKLKALKPIAPRRVVKKQITEEIKLNKSGDRQSLTNKTSWFLGGVAAAMVFAFVMISQRHEIITQRETISELADNKQEVPEASYVQEQAVELGDAPAELFLPEHSSSQIVRTKNKGYRYNADGSVQHIIEYELLDTHQWKDPQTKRVYKIQQPRLETVLVQVEDL